MEAPAKKLYQIDQEKRDFTNHINRQLIDEKIKRLTSNNLTENHMSEGQKTNNQFFLKKEAVELVSITNDSDDYVIGECKLLDWHSAKALKRILKPGDIIEFYREIDIKIKIFVYSVSQILYSDAG